MQDKSGYKFGIIGAGNIAIKFSNALNYLNYPLIAIASRSIDKAKNFQKRFNIPLIYDNYEEMLSNKEIDIIYIATPHGLHYEHLLLTLKYRKHVICEKAFTLNARQATEIFKIAKANNLLIMEAMWTRFLPLILKIQSDYQKNIYGKIKLIKASFGFVGNLDPKYRLLNRQLGGGCTLDIGVYPLNIVNLFLGTPLCIKANSILSATGVDLTMNATLEYENCQAIIETSIIEEKNNQAIIIFESGKLVINDFFQAKKAIFFDLNGKIIEEINIPYLNNGFEEQIISFVDTLSRNKLANDIMSHNHTIEILKQTDEIRKQLGIIYDCD